MRFARLNPGHVILVAALAASFLGACASNRAGDGAHPRKPLRVLVFSKTAGFRHDSIAAGRAAIVRLGAKHHFEVEATEDGAAFSPGHLDGYSVVLFLNTTGDVLDDVQQVSMEYFVRRGGGFVGIHAAADTEYGWNWYGRLVGAHFRSHPAVQDARVIIEDAAHPSTQALPSSWTRRDEWYNYRENPRGSVQVLLSLDTGSYSGDEMGGDHPIAWCHEFDGGRAWYTGGGHTIESFSEPPFLQHILGGIMWVAGYERQSTER